MDSNVKANLNRLNLILDQLLKVKAQKDQYFFWTAEEIRNRTDWTKDLGSSGIHYVQIEGVTDPVIKFTYAGFNFHFIEIPLVATN
jgi:hypothetical protein